MYVINRTVGSPREIKGGRHHQSTEDGYKENYVQRCNLYYVLEHAQQPRHGQLEYMKGHVTGFQV